LARPKSLRLSSPTWPKALEFGIMTQDLLVRVRTQGSWVRHPETRLLVLGLAFKRDPKFLGLTLHPNPFKLGSNKFNIIINIKNITICIKNIIVFIIINIINPIINKFEMNIIHVKKQP